MEFSRVPHWFLSQIKMVDKGDGSLQFYQGKETPFQGALCIMVVVRKKIFMMSEISSPTHDLTTVSAFKI